MDLRRTQGRKAGTDYNYGSFAESCRLADGRVAQPPPRIAVAAGRTETATAYFVRYAP